VPEGSCVGLVGGAFGRWKRWQASRLLFGSATVFAFALPACGVFEGQRCTRMGCISGVGTTLDVPMSPEELDGMRLELCHNERCAFAEMALASPQRLECTTAIANVGTVRCESFTGATASGARVTVSYSVASRDNLRDGDTFVVRIMDPSLSVTIAEKSGTIAKYEIVHPNGEDCAGDDYCRSGTF